MYWESRDLEDDLEDLHREASAMLAMLQCENREPTDREEELFQDILDLIRAKRAELEVLTM